MEKTGAQKRARVGGKVECGALRLGRGGLAAPGATRVQNRRWQSPECCQRARMNRGALFLSRYALPERGVQREWPPSLAKTVAGTKNGTVSRERRPEYNHCFHRARRLWRAGIRVRVRPAYILRRAKSRSGPGGSIVAVVVAYKSLLRKDLTRSYRADPAVRRPHECAQSPVAELRML